MSDERKPILLRDVRLIYKNFSGIQTQYNLEGDRNFCVVIDEEIANRLKSEGWNVKWGKPREDDDTPPPAYLPVSFSYEKYAPTITMVTGKNTKILTSEEASMLDWAEIIHVDLAVRPYHWQANGNSGIKAYLKSLYVTIEEDELAEEYSTRVAEEVASNE
jgi:hypothetical protein